jgi:molecular chaperone DnaK
MRATDAIAVGIDFGTTNSALCVLRGGGGPEAVSVRQLPGEETLPYLPGYVYFAAGRKVVVGAQARRFYHLKPHRVVRSVKRGLDATFRVGRGVLTGADLAAIVLRRLLAAQRGRGSRCAAAS